MECSTYQYSELTKKESEERKLDQMKKSFLYIRNWQNVDRDHGQENILSAGSSIKWFLEKWYLSE